MSSKDDRVRSLLLMHKQANEISVVAQHAFGITVNRLTAEKFERVMKAIGELRKALGEIEESDL